MIIDINTNLINNIFLTLVSVAAETDDDARLVHLSFSHTLSLSFSLQVSLPLTLVVLVFISAVTASLVDGCGGDVICINKCCFIIMFHKFSRIFHIIYSLSSCRKLQSILCIFIFIIKYIIP